MPSWGQILWEIVVFVFPIFVAFIFALVVYATLTGILKLLNDV